MLKKIGLLLVALGVVGALIFQDELRFVLQADAQTMNDQEVELLLDQEWSADSLAALLVRKNVLDSKELFVAMSELKGMEPGDFAAGRFIIKPHTKIRYLINGFKKNRLGNGNQEVAVDLRIPSKASPMEVLEQMCGQLLVRSEDIDSLLQNSQALKERGVMAERYRAFFLPNTYKVFYDVSAEGLVERLVKEYDRFWNDERMAQMMRLGFKHPAEVHTLASIVYAEQNRVPDEWSTIAGLYLNRLNKRMRLESDPTFKFCWGDKLEGVQRLLDKHKDVDCPYNTYKYGGLPPGPINVPPTECIEAALYPKLHKYLFMCAKPDYSGQHDFSKNYTQHLRYAVKYRRWLAAELRR